MVDTHSHWRRCTEDIKDLEPITDPLPVAEQPAALKIEAGRYYKTRDGRKVGPMVPYTDNMGGWEYKWTNTPDPDRGRLWREDGTSGRGLPEHDLVAEWVNAPIRDITAATVDAINDEYGPVVREVPVDAQQARFKVGDRVVERNYLGDGVDCFGTVLSVSDDGTTVYAEDWTAGVESGSLCIDNLELVVAADTQPQQARPLIRTKNGYGFELARVGDYVWVDIGQKAPITVRADTIKAA